MSEEIALAAADAPLIAQQAETIAQLRTEIAALTAAREDEADARRGAEVRAQAAELQLRLYTQTAHVPPDWRTALLSDRQQKEVAFSELYVRDFNHGIPGHTLYVLIARLAEALDQARPVDELLLNTGALVDLLGEAGWTFGLEGGHWEAWHASSGTRLHAATVDLDTAVQMFAIQILGLWKLRNRKNDDALLN